MTITLRPHQIEAADAVEEAFRASINRPLMDMCVSAGKSYTYAELARRAWLRGERTIIAADRIELVDNNAEACRALGLQVGINSATNGERTWRAPVISCQIQSVANSAQSFGPIGLLCGDEAHLWPHSEAGQFHALHRGLGFPRLAGGSGTPFRLSGGSLVEGEGAPFDKIVYRYSIIDGIRDGYLVPPVSVPVDDRIDPSKLRVRQGEYIGASSDDHMIAMMDNHIAQMIHYGWNRRSWLVFEASTKSAVAMTRRMNEWGISTALVLGSKSKADRVARRRALEQLRSGQIRAVVNLECLTTGVDVQEIDMLVCRRRTKSLSLWIQIVGRLLRTIGGNIQASIAAGKADGLLLDFADNTSEFGPLDFIRPKETTSRLVSCDTCGKRNAAAAARCWSCDAVMTKLCPACLVAVRRGELDCPHCQHDMRVERTEASAPKLFELPSGAALISSWKGGAERQGGWLPVRKVYLGAEGPVALVEDGTTASLAAFEAHAPDVRWLRLVEGKVAAVLLNNGAARLSARQIGADGSEVIVPMPGLKERVV